MHGGLTLPRLRRRLLLMTPSRRYSFDSWWAVLIALVWIYVAFVISAPNSVGRIIGVISANVWLAANWLDGRTNE